VVEVMPRRSPLDLERLRPAVRPEYAGIGIDLRTELPAGRKGTSGILALGGLRRGVT